MIGELGHTHSVDSTDEAVHPSRQSQMEQQQGQSLAPDRQKGNDRGGREPILKRVGETTVVVTGWQTPSSPPGVKPHTRHLL